MIVIVRNEHKARRFAVDMAIFRYEPHATKKANTHINNQADVGMGRSHAKRTVVASTGSDCRPSIQRTRVLLITTRPHSLLAECWVGGSLLPERQWRMKIVEPRMLQVLPTTPRSQRVMVQYCLFAGVMLAVFRFVTHHHFQHQPN
jgi:hypothetical protein